MDALPTRHRRTGHAIMLALSEGFVATVLVLAERAGMSAPPDGGTWAAQLREKSRELGRFMPR